MTTSAEPFAELRAARVQLGGGWGVDDLGVARLGRALGPNGLVLGGSTTFVADHDVCRHEGEPISGDELERLARAGRLCEAEGAFAAAWLDPDGSLHLARDALGERSLYYAGAAGSVAFASSPQALLESGLVPRVLRRASLAAYLTFGYLPGSETLVEGIRQLPPGQHLVFGRAGRREERLWQLPAEEPAGDEEILRLRLRARLEAAVRARLPHEGPVAATLSGGIDSSLVAALAARLHHSRVVTFSLGFGRGIPNELDYAAAVARRCGSDHHVLTLEPRAVMDRFDETIAALATPIGEPLTVANSVLFSAAAQVAPVVLNGEGGDPCFGGPKNVPMLLAGLYGPAATGRAAWSLERMYMRAHRKCLADLPAALEPELVDLRALEATISEHLSNPCWSGLVNRLTAMNVALKGGHHILPKVEQLSRPWGVLPRSPLFDRGVVDVALRLPGELKLRRGVEKVILKAAVADLVPQEVLERPKSGMRVPVELWLDGRFERFARERLLDGALDGVVRRSYLEELARPDREHPPRSRGAKVWLLLSLESWLRTVLREGS